MGVEINAERTVLIVNKVLGALEQQQGFFSEGVFRPEELFIELAKDYGRKTGKSEFAPNAVFLKTAFVFGDDTGKLFSRITDPNRLAEYSWIFNPSEALVWDDGKIMAGCASFFRPAGYNRRVVQEWSYNIRILGERYGSDIRNFLDELGGDAERVVQALTVRPRAKTEEKRKKGVFTRYGPKLSALVVQWMNQYGLYEFQGTNGGGLPVDFQVARVLVQTGGVTLKQPENVHQVTTAVNKVLGQVTYENGWDTRRVSEVLWNVGNQGCNKKRHNDCPLEQECDRLISRKSYDKDGKFDPKDTGRWE